MIHIFLPSKLFIQTAQIELLSKFSVYQQLNEIIQKYSRIFSLSHLVSVKSYNSVNCYRKYLPKRPLQIHSQRNRKGRKLFRKQRSGRRRSKAIQFSPHLLRDPPGYTGTRGGSLTTGLSAGNGFVNCCPPKVSLITFGMFNTT